MNSPPPSVCWGLSYHRPSSLFWPHFCSLFFSPEGQAARRRRRNKRNNPRGTKRRIYQSGFQKQLPRYIIMMETFCFLVAEGEVNKPRVTGALPLSGMFFCIWMAVHQFINKPYPQSHPYLLYFILFILIFHLKLFLTLVHLSVLVLDTRM